MPAAAVSSVRRISGRPATGWRALNDGLGFLKRSPLPAARMTASLTGADKLTKQPQIHKVFVRHGGRARFGRSVRPPRFPLFANRSVMVRAAFGLIARGGPVFPGPGAGAPARAARPTNAHTTIRTSDQRDRDTCRRAQAEDLGGHRGARFINAKLEGMNLKTTVKSRFAVSRMNEVRSGGCSPLIALSVTWTSSTPRAWKASSQAMTTATTRPRLDEGVDLLFERAQLLGAAGVAAAGEGSKRWRADATGRASPQRRGAG